MQKLDDKSKERLGFERELYKYLDKLMLELASKIRRNTDRLAAEEAAPLPPADQVCANARHLSKHCVDAMAVLMQPGMQPGVAGSSP